jgi:hypothetical protein
MTPPNLVVAALIPATRELHVLAMGICQQFLVLAPA